MIPPPAPAPPTGGASMNRSSRTFFQVSEFIVTAASSAYQGRRREAQVVG